MDAKSKIIEKEDGQALIEFLLFFPFLLMMYSVTLSIANSINASINQQKVTRAYFYYRMQNNSMAPTPYRGASDSNPYSRFGQHVNLWAEKDIDDIPVAACFKFNVPLGDRDEDVCEEGYSERTTQYIRVGTAYGICGATYQSSQGSYVRLPNYSAASVPGEVVAESACLVSN